MNISHFLKCCFSLIFLYFSFLVHNTYADKDQFFKGNQYAKPRLVPSLEVVTPQTRHLSVGVEFEIEPGWHMYWKNPGFSKTNPNRYSWNLNQSLDTIWSTPKIFTEKREGSKKEVLVNGYEKMAFSSTDFKVMPEGDFLEIKLKARWLVCSTRCVPGQKTITTKIPIRDKQVQNTDYEKLSKLLPKDPSEARFINGDEGFELRTSFVQDSQGDPLIEIAIDGLNSFDAGLMEVFPYASMQASFGNSYYDNTPDNLIAYLPFKLEEGVESFSAAGIVKISSIDGGSRAFFWQSPKFKSSLKKVSLKNANQAINGLKNTNSSIDEDIEVANSSMLYIMLLAFVGGFILNFMPCVLPVISLKAFRMSTLSNKKENEIRISSFTYSLGVISAIVFLAFVVVSLRGLGHSAGWGFQFRSPAYVLSLALIIFTLALSFFDLYHFSFSKFIPQLGNKGNYIEDFLEGILATALATPCSAPLLGTALAFSLSKPSFFVVILFFTIGLGLSFPFLLLAFKPSFSRFIPKPGEWMNTLKVFLGFVLIASTIWLLNIYFALVGLELGLKALNYILVIAFCVWIIGIESRGKVSKALQYLFFTAVFISLINSIVHDLSSNKEISDENIWVEFYPGFLDDYQDQTVFVDVTAEWCLTCKTNEYLVLDTKEVVDFFKTNNIVPVIVDWTSENKEIEQFIKPYYLDGLPIYLVFKPGQNKPEVLPTILTKDLLFKRLKNK